ncbi:helix-turn-helix domain-containing protein [Nocardioides sp. GY 10127]|uniref:helix-turn-helix domain-containing protein n=1 Tax=Nocardioides sp. GY 10127 TaxID=2569762 RepID=UPI0010A7FAD9|nr:helix-turn-helix domain-containing protein [Nocardioides sp. GY 10127]TIC79461.1 PucR family transcriptional regulator [Nocardioides sp. GY 10127]
MHQLAGRLTALDPDAGEALRVIPYFDELLNQRAGLESVVRGIAVLSGAPARLITEGRRLPLRVLPDGRRDDVVTGPDDAWQQVSSADGGIVLCLERPGPSGPVDAMVLERGLQAVRTVHERTHGRYRAPGDRAGELHEVLTDPDAGAVSRAHAARQLGLATDQLVRVVCPLGGTARVVAVVPTMAGADVAATAVPGERCGVGPVVPVERAPESARDARLALRLTAPGTAAEPGSRVVVVDDLGAAIAIAASFDATPAWREHPDLAAVRAAAAHAAWVPGTLSAVASTDSLRSAAAALVVHHSTLQKRLATLEKLLAWDVLSTHGRFRLQVALMLLRLDDTRD